MPVKKREFIDSDFMQKISELTTSLGITNQYLADMAKKVDYNTKVIFGDTAEGGIVSRLNTHREEIDDAKSSLKELTKDCSEVMGMIKIQVESIHNLNRIVFGLGAGVILLLILIGGADARNIWMFLVSL